MNFKPHLRKTQILSRILTCWAIFLPLTVVAQDQQKGQNSEALVTFDYTNPEAKPVIPFDKYFTLQVLHFNTQKIYDIKVYEATYTQGVMTLKQSYVNKLNQQVSKYVFKIKDYKAKHDTPRPSKRPRLDE